MKCIFAFLSFVVMLNCSSQHQQENQMPLEFEIVHQSKFDVLEDYAFVLLKNQEEIDNIYKYLSASPKGLRQIPIPSYDENETLIAVSATPKSKNDIDIKSVNLIGDKINIEIIDVDNPQLGTSGRLKSLVIIKLLNNYKNKSINLIIK